MRSKARLLMAAVLSIGSLATAGAITTARPALAMCPPSGTCCPPGDTCDVPPPPPPPPPVTYSTSGLAYRNVMLSPSPNAAATIQIGAKESFTATAASRTSGATVALGGEDRYTCASPSGVNVTFDYVYVPTFTTSPKTVTRQPFSCPGGDVLTTGTYQLYAEAENSSGALIGRTPTQTYQFTPDLTVSNVSVPESGGDPGVNTGLVLVPGDTVTFTATGQIWAGVILTGNNGPLGWTDYDGCQAKFPLYCAPPYSLIGNLNNDGGYFYIGSGGGAAQPPYPTLSPAGVSGTRISDLYPDPPSLNLITAPTQLMLRTNDDAPGNGSGAFSVSIQVERDNRF